MERILDTDVGNGWGGNGEKGLRKRGEKVCDFDRLRPKFAEVQVRRVGRTAEEMRSSVVARATLRAGRRRRFADPMLKGVELGAVFGA